MPYEPIFDKITEKELNPTLRDKIDASYTHIDNSTMHVTSIEKANWNTGALIDIATSTINGLMSSTLVAKLNSISAGANNYSHPLSGVSAGTYISTKIDVYGHVIQATNPTRLDVTVSDSDKLGGITAASYASIASPVFMGIPKAPTPDVGTTTSQLATTEFVHNVLTFVSSNLTPYIHPTSGVSAGSYLVTTVDANGHVTAGTNPTSLNITVTTANNLGSHAAAEYSLLNSPVFSGTPTVPTATVDTNSLQVANTKFVQTLVSAESGIPIGHEFLQINPNPPADCLPYRGGLYARASYPDLWAWVQLQTGYLKTDAQWSALASSQNGSVPFYSSGDGSTTFRVPYIGEYVRGTRASETTGTYYSDAIRNIYGTFGADDKAAKIANGAFYSSTQNVTDTSANGGDGAWWNVINFDASRIVPTADENRPKTIVGIWCVKALK